MEFFKKKVIVTAVLSAFVLPTSAFATNGMQSIGNGAKSRGMGGVGVALANETGSIVTNPAAAINVGDRLDVSLTLFSPTPRRYKLTGNEAIDPVSTGSLGSFDGDQKSENDLFFIPGFGMTFPINEKSIYAFGMAAAGGMNTEYKKNFAANLTFVPRLTKKTGMNLEQLYVTNTYGRKLNKDTSVGITAFYAFQTLEVTGLTAFGNFGASSDRTKLSNNGKDTSSGVGYKIGFQTGFSNLRIGASYQGKTKMSKFKKYAGLLANQGEMDIPPTFTAGIALKLGSSLLVAFDYQNIDYASVDAIGNSITKNTVEGKLFGSTDGPGFGWKSIDIYKLGFEYQYDKEWTFRTGYNLGENPITKDEISVSFLAPALITNHFTLGFTKKIDEHSEYTVNMVRGFKSSLTADFAEKFGGGEMTVEMEQSSIEASYSKLF